MTFHLTCVRVIFSSVWVSEWPPARSVGRVFLIFVILVISRYAFEGWIWILVASVPDH